ncbi:MAG TPA: hypothetical protein DHV36_25610 [Desulfobacteraceae bacterium]|nr:hypothetical protein [Desulfobacteraceae bacterium]|tara:strand:+ start:539 stop:1165 length:627 start_codon:yes stop_codon:yes gene_type:complete
MKSPWVTFAGICSLVFGIVIFSVIFGGYSSLLRSQNRIYTAKNQLVTQCREQLGLIEDLPGAQMDALPLDTMTRLNEATGKIKRILDAIETSKEPLEPNLVNDFELAQIQVNQSIALAADQMGTGEENKDSPSNQGTAAFKKRSYELETAVFIMGKRYNKEARYFNTRTMVFPGFLIARLFGLDRIKFPELDVRRLAPSGDKRTASAS